MTPHNPATRRAFPSARRASPEGDDLPARNAYLPPLGLYAHDSPHHDYGGISNPDGFVPGSANCKYWPFHTARYFFRLRRSEEKFRNQDRVNRDLVNRDVTGYVLGVGR